MSEFAREFVAAAKEAPRLYVEPLVGMARIVSGAVRRSAGPVGVSAACVADPASCKSMGGAVDIQAIRKMVHVQADKIDAMKTQMVGVLETGAKVADPIAALSARCDEIAAINARLGDLVDVTEPVAGRSGSEGGTGFRAEP